MNKINLIVVTLLTAGTTNIPALHSETTQSNANYINTSIGANLQISQDVDAIAAYLDAHDTAQNENWVHTLANDEANPDPQAIRDCLFSDACTIDMNQPATVAAVERFLNMYMVINQDYQQSGNLDPATGANYQENLFYLNRFWQDYLIGQNPATDDPDSSTPPGGGDTGGSGTGGFPSDRDTGGGTTDGSSTETGTFTFSNGLTADPTDTIGTYNGTVDTSPLFGFANNTNLAVTGLNVNSLDLDGDGTPIGSDPVIDIDGDGTPLGKESDPGALFTGILPTQGSVYDIATFNFLGTWEFVYADQAPLSSSTQTTLSQLLPSDISPTDLVHPGITAEIVTPFSSSPIDVSWLFQAMESLGIDVNSLL